MQRCRNSMLIFSASGLELNQVSFSRASLWTTDATWCWCFCDSLFNLSSKSWILSLSFLRREIAMLELSELSSNCLRFSCSFLISVS
uniref:Tho2 protein, putative n=1 Tax=Arundo donax TaxID=35708 RepID=A0A0A8YBK6_ARUDO